jgi:hypothetical protein
MLCLTSVIQFKQLVDLDVHFNSNGHQPGHQQTDSAVILNCDKERTSGCTLRGKDECYGVVETCIDLIVCDVCSGDITSSQRDAWNINTTTSAVRLRTEPLDNYN